tara:strand:+ start:98 stop:610 length:513 start_codon:yes stop_codon:yes gene_type:complete
MSAVIQAPLAEADEKLTKPLVGLQEKPREVTHTIALVPPNYINSLWFDVRDHLAPAIDRSHGRWSMEYLYAAIANGQQHLWVAFDKDNQIDGVCTTEITHYPCKKMLALQYLGGTNFNMWVWDMLDRFNTWAADNGCAGIEGTARHGFWKWLEQDGFVRSYTVYEKEVSK